ncbi:IDEAL domain-containing protein [Paenibacillus sp. TAF58]
MNFVISDWVVATTNEDEMLHGYVESIDVLHGIARVQVIASDRETAIGKIMEVSSQDVKKLPVSEFDIEEQVKSLIDVALTTRDEQWFNELSAKLFAIQRNGTKRGERDVFPSYYHNRLGVDQF